MLLLLTSQDWVVHFQFQAVVSDVGTSDGTTANMHYLLVQLRSGVYTPGTIAANQLSAD